MSIAGLVAIEGFAESTAMPKNTWWVTMAALTDTGTTHQIFKSYYHNKFHLFT